MSNSIQNKIFRDALVARRKKFVFKREKGVNYRAEKIVTPRKNIGNCSYCDTPVYSSSEQLITYRNGTPTHKICRKNNK